MLSKRGRDRGSSSPESPPALVPRRQRSAFSTRPGNAWYRAAKKPRQGVHPLQRPSVPKQAASSLDEDSDLEACEREREHDVAQALFNLAEVAVRCAERGSPAQSESEEGLRPPRVKRPAAAAAAAAETSGVPKKGSSIQAHRSSSGQGFASTGPRARPQQRLSAARSSGATGSEPTERPDRRHSISAHRPVPKPQPPEAQPARESLSRAGPETASMFAALPAGCYPVAGHTHPWYPPGRDAPVPVCPTPLETEALSHNTRGKLRTCAYHVHIAHFINEEVRKKRIQKQHEDLDARLMQPLHHSAPGPGMDSKAHLSGAPADYSSLAAQRPTAGPVKAEAPVQPNGHSHLPAYLQMQATQAKLAPLGLPYLAGPNISSSLPLLMGRSPFPGAAGRPASALSGMQPGAYLPPHLLMQSPRGQYSSLPHLLPGAQLPNGQFQLPHLTPEMAKLAQNGALGALFQGQSPHLMGLPTAAYPTAQGPVARGLAPMPAHMPHVKLDPSSADMHRHVKPENGKGERQPALPLKAEQVDQQGESDKGFVQATPQAGVGNGRPGAGRMEEDLPARMHMAGAGDAYAALSQLRHLPHAPDLGPDSTAGMMEQLKQYSHGPSGRTEPSGKVERSSS